MRAISYGAPLLCLLQCTAAWAQSPDAAGGLIVSRVAGNVYLLDDGTSRFGGGNVAVLVGDDGLLLVDSQSKDANHAAVAAALKQLSDKPVRYVIDTHCHGDHTGGNAAFQRGGATIIAHANVLRRLEQKACDPIELGLPTITIDAGLTLHVAGEEVRVIAPPVGHTDGDVIVYFKQANVVVTGDIFTPPQAPSHSRRGGKLLGIAEALRMVVAAVPADAKVIPGHGPVSTVDDIRRTIQDLDGMREAVARQIAAGKSLKEIEALNVLEPWKKVVLQPDRLLTAFYEALSAERTPGKASP